MRIRSLHRRSLRLSADYRQCRSYFLTLCVSGRHPLFGILDTGRVRLSKLGEIVRAEWEKSGSLRKEVRLDEYVVMPDHFHAIVHFDGTTQARCPMEPGEFRRTGGDLGSLIAGFKCAVTRRINHVRGTPRERVWQRGYWESFIRDARHLEAARRYIALNPIRAS